MFTSILVSISALVLEDFVLFCFALGFLILSAVSIGFIKISKLNWAIHTMLNGFLFGFTITPFFKIYYLSGLLIFPLIIALAIFFVQDPLKRLFYALLCAIGCALFIFETKGVNYTSIESNYIAEFLIAFGLLSALFIVGYNYFVVIFRYQVKLEQSEKLMLNKNQQLEHYIDSNLQLENFAHLASHELKSPLKNIVSFSNLLAKKLEDKIPNKEREMLSIIENQAKEMDELIKDLFELSTVTNEPMETGDVELDRVLKDMIKFEFFEQKEFIRINNLPQIIQANKTFIKEVFKNLITNALKFIASDRIAQITIDCKELQDKYQFSVKDNGIGIQKDKRDKVFLIFKRLHSTKEYEGTGIGLAICKKIIERHLGQIWIEDNPDGGSIFKFTIAKNIA